MDATEGALELLDLLERNDLEGMRSSAIHWRSARLDLKQDGLELVERAVALDRPEALNILLRLGASDHQGELFGAYCHDFLERMAARCLESGKIRILLELLAYGAILPPLRHDEQVVERVARAAVVESGLDDERVAQVARACGTNRGAFLVHALRAGRMSLVQCLASTCTARQWFGANRLGDVPLVAAAEAGATASLACLVAAGAKPNVALRGTGYPLHRAICCERLQPAERAKLVRELLRLGAVPELRDANGRNAYALAEARGDAAVRQVLRDDGLAHGPRQSREARAQGVRDVRLLYDKADGLIYRIGQPDVPFLEGGDYDGIGPCTMVQFRDAFQRLSRERRETPLAWFEPFLDRLECGQEFGYDDLVSRAPHLRVVRFDENSNWSQMID